MINTHRLHCVKSYVVDDSSVERHDGDHSRPMFWILSMINCFDVLYFAGVRLRVADPCSPNLRRSLENRRREPFVPQLATTDGQLAEMCSYATSSVCNHGDVVCKRLNDVVNDSYNSSADDNEHCTATVVDNPYFWDRVHSTIPQWHLVFYVDCCETIAAIVCLSQY